MASSSQSSSHQYNKRVTNHSRALEISGALQNSDVESRPVSREVWLSRGMVRRSRELAKAGGVTSLLRRRARGNRADSRLELLSISVGGDCLAAA